MTQRDFRKIIPSEFQPPLPLQKLLLDEHPNEDALSFDVLFVGGGPAGLAGAIYLKKLALESNHSRLKNIEIAVLEKASHLGEHSLSGAIINPHIFFELFPELTVSDFPFELRVQDDRLFVMTEFDAVRIPSPKEMHNKNFFVASLCEVVRWLGKKAEELGIQMITGFSAGSLIMKGQQVLGVRTTPSGLMRDLQPGLSAHPGPTYLPPSDLVAKVTVLAEGTRGALTQAYLELNKISSSNPQIFALGVKELWETQEKTQIVAHTLGWPIPKDCFGGGWIYPMGKNRVSFGLVVGLDYSTTTLDVHELLQQYKSHPLLKSWLKGGKLLEWGAKTIPEGGYYSIPERLHGKGILIIGDSAGFVNVAALKGIHYAMRSGMIAAKTLSNALLKEDCSSEILSEYDALVNKSEIIRDLYRTRNMRLAFKSGFYKGGFKAELMSLTQGKFPGDRISVRADAQEPKAVVPCEPEVGLRKEDAVFYSGNVTRDNIPQHLIVGKDIPPEVAEFYSHLCPAGVYQQEGDHLVVRAPNCIDCKATDILGPRWLPREGGSGPRYQEM